MKPLYLIIHYFFIFVKLKARFSRFSGFSRFARFSGLGKLGFRSVRTLMSIDAQLSHGEKVRRTLMSIASGLTVERGPVPRLRRSHRKLPGTPLCRSRSPDLDLFAIWRSRTTGAWGGGSPRSPPLSVEQDRLILLGRRQKILLHLGYLENPASASGP